LEEKTKVNIQHTNPNTPALLDTASGKIW